MKKLLLASALAFAWSAASANNITIDHNLYCSAGSNPTTNSDTSSNFSSLNDVTLKIGSTNYTSSDCYGPFDPGNASWSNETNALNSIFKNAGAEFVYLDRSDDAGSTSGLGGITFTVTENQTDNQAKSGTWSVTWTDHPGDTNLPITLDLAVLLSGGNNNAGYLLSNVVLPIAPTGGSGTFDIEFLNQGGNQPDIAHLSLVGRIVDAPTGAAPEPASLALLTAGLIGAGLVGVAGTKRSSRRSRTMCR